MLGADVLVFEVLESVKNYRRYSNFWNELFHQVKRKNAYFMSGEATSILFLASRDETYHAHY